MKAIAPKSKHVYSRNPTVLTQCCGPAVVAGVSEMDSHLSENREQVMSDMPEGALDSAKSAEHIPCSGRASERPSAVFASKTGSTAL